MAQALNNQLLLENESLPATLDVTLDTLKEQQQQDTFKNKQQETFYVSHWERIIARHQMYINILTNHVFSSQHILKEHHPNKQLEHEDIFRITVRISNKASKEVTCLEEYKHRIKVAAYKECGIVDNIPNEPLLKVHVCTDVIKEKSNDATVSQKETMHKPQEGSLVTLLLKRSTLTKERNAINDKIQSLYNELKNKNKELDSVDDAILSIKQQ
jgi:hypothetical protein